MHSERTTAFALVVATVATIIAAPVLIPYWILKWARQKARGNKG